MNTHEYSVAVARPLRKALRSEGFSEYEERISANGVLRIVIYTYLKPATDESRRLIVRVAPDYRKGE